MDLSFGSKIQGNFGVIPFLGQYRMQMSNKLIFRRKKYIFSLAANQRETKWVLKIYDEESGLNFKNYEGI
jgi:hypothetical protein